jgi:hypothetical protein
MAAKPIGKHTLVQEVEARKLGNSMLRKEISWIGGVWN